jgi:hypothetical protein
MLDNWDLRGDNIMDKAKERNRIFDGIIEAINELASKDPKGKIDKLEILRLASKKLDMNMGKLQGFLVFESVKAVNDMRIKEQQSTSVSKTIKPKDTVKDKGWKEIPPNKDRKPPYFGELLLIL